jgi:hypothetical protein
MCWRRLRLIVAIHKTSYLSHLNSNYPYFSLLNGSPYEEFCCYVILDDPFISSRSNRDGRSRVFPVCEVVNHLASSFIWSPFCCFQQPHSSLIKQRLSHGPFLIAGTPTSGLRRVWLSLQHLPLDPVRYCRGPWKNLVLCGARILIFLERNAHQRLSHRPFLKARMALYPLREVISNLFCNQSARHTLTMFEMWPTRNPLLRHCFILGPCSILRFMSLSGSILTPCGRTVRWKIHVNTFL